MTEISAAKDERTMEMPTMEQIINGMKKMMKPMEVNPDDAIASFIADHPGCKLLMNPQMYQTALKAGLKIPEEMVIITEMAHENRIYMVSKEMARRGWEL